MTVYLLVTMKNKSFTHILQKTGVLKTFTVAKVVKKKDIDELKALLKGIASDDVEYKKLLSIEMKKISEMHNINNPIPGIIYSTGENSNKENLVRIAIKFCKIIKTQKFDKRELAFLISVMIDKLSLTQEDFINLKEENESQIDDDDDDDDDDDNDDAEDDTQNA